MIIKKIYEHAKLHVDGDFPWVHARRWILEAQNIIATDCDTGSIADNIEIEVEEVNKWYDLPSNLILVERVYLNGRKTNDYKVEPLRIFLKDKGNYRIEYKRLPKVIGLESDEPEIHELYHFPMSYWLASREEFRFNPDNPDGQRLEATFLSEIRRVDQRLSKDKRVRKIKV